jgi:hypothetical protein
VSIGAEMVGPIEHNLITIRINAAFPTERQALPLTTFLTE